MIAAAAVVVVAIGGAVGDAEVARQHGPRQSVLCRRDQLWRLRSNWLHEHLIIRNDVFGLDASECIAVWGRGQSSFKVISLHRVPSDGVVAYPNIYLGSEYGKQSGKSPLPVRAGTLSHWEVTWLTARTRPKGIWNKAIDIWFMLHPHPSGQAGGAELMIWLDTTLPVPPGTPKAKVGGVWYHYTVHRPCRGVGGGQHICWNRISFWRIHHVYGVRGLSLAAYLHFAEGLDLLNRHWYATSIEAGFEVTSGGIGLQTIRFGVIARSSAAHRVRPVHYVPRHGVPT
jgi:Glycosyl hydrolase family 12